MNFDKVDLIEGALIFTNEDGSVTCIPEQDCTLKEGEMFAEFRQAFPNGKPKPIIEPTPQAPSLDERIAALEDAFLSML